MKPFIQFIFITNDNNPDKIITNITLPALKQIPISVEFQEAPLTDCSSVIFNETEIFLFVMRGVLQMKSQLLSKLN